MVVDGVSDGTRPFAFPVRAAHAAPVGRLTFSATRLAFR
jgi:hypothetical protein